MLAWTIQLGIVSPPEADPIRVFLRSREGTREGRKRIKKKKGERDVGCPRPPLKLTWETQPTEKSSHKMLWSSEDNLDTKFFFLQGGTLAGGCISPGFISMIKAL